MSNNFTLEVLDDNDVVQGMATSDVVDSVEITVGGQVTAVNLAATEYIEYVDIATGPRGPAGPSGDTAEFRQSLYRSDVITSSATPTPYGSSHQNDFEVSALSTDAIFQAPIGPVAQSNRLLIALKDDGTARAIAWNVIYSEIGGPLPLFTIAGKVILIGFIYRAASATWQTVSVRIQP